MSLQKLVRCADGLKTVVNAEQDVLFYGHLRSVQRRQLKTLDIWIVNSAARLRSDPGSNPCGKIELR